MSTTRTVYRDSESGEFTTKKYADKNPKSTEKEKVKIPTSPNRKK